VVEE
jgi:hypothetical protein